METSLITQWFSDHQIKAICWTLLHSLWIGLIGALLAGMLISFTRKSRAQIRYNSLCGILLLFIMAMGLTYYLQVSATEYGPLVAHTDNIGRNNNDADVSIYVGDLPKRGIVSQSVNFLNQHINIIFLSWLVIFMFRVLKLAGGLLYIQRIRNYRVHAVAEELKHKINMFSSQIGVSQTVRLLQSELVDVPMIIGWLKPVILLPMGLIVQLPAEQLESILWHELAHIHRRDYLVNILQGLVETVFFFNPGLRWLSSLIRAEREACCDDIALSRTKHKANYLNALLAFGYNDNSRTTLAMAIGSGNQLRDRLRRMVNKENTKLSVTEKFVLMCGLVLLLAFTTISKDYPVMAASGEKDSTALTDTAVHFSYTSFRLGASDSIINEVKSEDRHGKKYHLVITGNRLLAMHINGDKVKDNDLQKYEYMIGLFRKQEKIYAAALAKQLKASSESGKQQIDSLLRK